MSFDLQPLLRVAYLKVISQKMVHNFFGTIWVIYMRPMTETFKELEPRFITDSVDSDMRT